MPLKLQKGRQQAETGSKTKVLWDERQKSVIISLDNLVFIV